MTFFSRLRRSTHASSTVDFAFALPVLMIIMLGTLQLGVYMHVSGSLRHALGEGIRYAKVYPSATADDVKNEIKSELPAIDPDNITALVFIRGTSGSIDYGAAGIRYRLEPIIPLIPVPAITITETSVAYLPS